MQKNEIEKQWYERGVFKMWRLAVCFSLLITLQPLTAKAQQTDTKTTSSGIPEIPCLEQTVRSAAVDAPQVVEENLGPNEQYQLVLREPLTECLVQGYWLPESYYLEPRQLYWRWEYQVLEELPNGDRLEISNSSINIPVGELVFDRSIDDWVNRYGPQFDDTMSQDRYWTTENGVTVPSQELRNFSQYLALTIAMNQVYMGIPLHEYPNVGTAQLLLLNDEHAAAGELLGESFDCSTNHVDDTAVMLLNTYGNDTASVGYEGFEYGRIVTHELGHLLFARKSNEILRLSTEHVPFGSIPEEALVTMLEYYHYLEEVANHDAFQAVRDSAFLHGVDILTELNLVKAYFLADGLADWYRDPYKIAYHFFNEVRLEPWQVQKLAQASLTQCLNGNQPNHMAQTLSFVGEPARDITQVMTDMTANCLYLDTLTHMISPLERQFVGRCTYDDLGITNPVLDDQIEPGYTCRRYFGSDLDSRDFWITLPVNEDSFLLVPKSVTTNEGNVALEIEQIPAQGQQMYINNLPTFTDKGGTNICYANMSDTSQTFVLQSIEKNSLTNQVFLPSVQSRQTVQVAE